MKSVSYEILQTLQHSNQWTYLAWNDVLLRYRRTVIGPFWMVITTFISIVCTACLGALLFHVKLDEFFPYVAAGTICWTYIAGLLSESTSVFVSQQGIIKNIYTPVLSFCFRLCVRNTIVFMHNWVVLFLVLLYFKVPLNFNSLFFFVSLFIYFINFVALSTLIGLACTRYRDLTQVITSALSILAFLTPIMWKAEMLGKRAIIAYLNPLTHFINLMREPLLGKFPSLSTLCVVSLITVLNVYVAYVIFAKFKNRLVYWL